MCACRTPPCVVRSRPREHVVLWEQDEGTTGKQAENVEKNNLNGNENMRFTDI